MATTRKTLWYQRQSVQPKPMTCYNLKIVPLFLEALYLAPTATLLAALKKATGFSVLMIGHNFGISDLTNGLRKDMSANSVFKAFPLGAICLAHLPTEN